MIFGISPGIARGTADVQKEVTYGLRTVADSPHAERDNLHFIARLPLAQMGRTYLFARPTRAKRSNLIVLHTFHVHNERTYLFVHAYHVHKEVTHSLLHTDQAQQDITYVLLHTSVVHDQPPEGA